MITAKELIFFITHHKETDEFILQEGNLLILKIPKSWQKLDPDTKNPALWVCHLPNNSLGINYVSLYPSELVIKKEVGEYKAKWWKRKRKIFPLPVKITRKENC